MRRAAAAVMVLTLALPLAGCFMRTTVAAPAAPTALGDAHLEFDVVLGVEAHFDDTSVFNPLAGRTRVGLGAGLVVETDDGAAGAGAHDEELVAGVMTVEVGHTLWQRDAGGRPGAPDRGGLVRVTALAGLGDGTLRRRGGEGGVVLGAADASLATVSVGLEGLVHFGGDDADSGTFALGAGLRWGAVDAGAMGGGRRETVAPYASFTMSGACFTIALFTLGKGRCR